MIILVTLLISSHCRREHDVYPNHCQAQKERAYTKGNREKLEVGTSIVEAEHEFADGYCNGSLYYYDTNHQLPRPLTSEALCSFMMDNLFDQRATARWNAGFVTGWIAALSENNPAFFFTSIVIAEPTRHTEPLPTL